MSSGQKFWAASKKFEGSFDTEKQFLLYYSVRARPTRVNTERLAERETLLYRLFPILVETPLSVAQITRDFSRSQVFFANGTIHTKKEAKKGS
jgi:hypothetical protein